MPRVNNTDIIITMTLIQAFGEIMKLSAPELAPILAKADTELKTGAVVTTP